MVDVLSSSEVCFSKDMDRCIGKHDPRNLVSAAFVLSTRAPSFEFMLCDLQSYKYLWIRLDPGSSDLS